MNISQSFQSVSVSGRDNTVGIITTDEEGRKTQDWVDKNSSQPFWPSLPEFVATKLANNVFENPSFRRCLETRGHTLVLFGKPGVGKTTTMLQLLQRLKAEDLLLDSIPLHEEASCVDSPQVEQYHWLGSLPHYLAMIPRGPLDSVFGFLTSWLGATRLGAWLLTPRGPHPECGVHFPRASPVPQEMGPIVTAAIFYKYQDKSTDESKGESQPAHDRLRILMDIQAQLAHQTSEGLKFAGDLRRRLKRAGLQARDVSDTIIAMLKTIPRACLFLDAMDECAPDQRRAIMRELKRIQDETKVGIVMSDRVGSNDSTYPKNKAPNRDFVQIGALEVDMDQFLQSSLEDRYTDDPEQLAWVHEEGTKRDVIKQIIAASGDIFLLARLNLGFIAGSRTGEGDLAMSLNALKDMCYSESEDSSKDDYLYQVLDKAYERNLRRVLELDDGRERDDAKRTLSFIRDSFRPLLELELIALLEESLCKKSIMWRRLERCCQGLVVKDTSGIVGYLHRSLRRFLESDSALKLLRASHQDLGKACISYIQSSDCGSGICQEQAALQRRLKAWPLLDYAARYWTYHLTQFEGTGVPSDVEQFTEGSLHDKALVFLQDSQRVDSICQIRLFEDKILQRVIMNALVGSSPVIQLNLTRSARGKRDPFASSMMSGVHVTCRYNLKTLARKLIKITPTSVINRKDIDTQVPLHYAAMNNNAELVGLLLDAGADPDIKTEDGATAIMAANIEVAKILMKRCNININEASYRAVPFEDHAFRLGQREGVPELQPVGYHRSVGGRTLLQMAARAGNLELLELCLADPKLIIDAEDDAGMTALHRATKKGHLDCVERLHKAGADPARKVGRPRESPTSMSASGDDSFSSWYQATALHIACFYGRSGPLVSYLLNHCPTTICNEVDASGWTALHCAALCKVPKSSLALLLQQPGLKFNLVGNFGTPLHMVSTVEGLKLFLSQEGVDVMARDKDQKTALHYFANFSHEEHIRELLIFPGIDINALDSTGRSPIFYAAVSGYFKAFEVLWNDPRLDRTLRDNEKQTVLEYATASGKAHKEVLTLLSSSEDDSTS